MNKVNSCHKNAIGVLGGSFNPIHLGHIELAVNAHEQFGISQILVMPSGDPSSYKDTSKLASATDRINMIKEAISGYDFLELSTIETDRPGRTYTSDTLKILKKDYDYIYFIIGADSFMALDHWYDTDYLLRNCHFLVAKRNDSKTEIGTEMLLKQKAYLYEKYGTCIDFMNNELLPYSSTDIRSRIKSNQDVTNMLPLGVYDYIKENGIYIL